MPVLLFHRVSPDPDPFWPPLCPDHFRDLLTFLNARYSFLPLSRLLDEERIPDDAAFITFDDAFKDFEDHALPVLDGLGLPATLFVPTGSINRQELIWPALLDRYLEIHWEEEAPRLEIKGFRIEWGGWRKEGKEACAGRLKRTIMEQNKEVQMGIREELEGKGYSEHIRPMSWEALSGLPASIELGGHTVDHPFLPSIQDRDWIEKEIEGGKIEIEEKTGRKVRFFAYPFGGYDDKSVKIVSNYVDAAFTTDDGLLSVASLDVGRWTLPRVNMVDTDPKEGFLRINGLHHMLRSLKLL